MLLNRSIRYCAFKIKANTKYILQNQKLCTTNETIANKSIDTQTNSVEIPKKSSLLTPATEDLDYIAPHLKPTFNFAAYVNNSPTLQELLKLGVNLYSLEKRENVPEYILALNFETQIKPHVMFLHDKGLTVEQIGDVITKNPFIFKETLDNFQVRINYLLSKKFNGEMITSILQKNPFWLSFSTHHIDQSLGLLQKTFSLTGNEVRTVAVSCPKLVTTGIRHIQENLFAIKEEMGFSQEEYKMILLRKPRVFLQARSKTTATFDYLHTQMKIPQEIIAKMPELLTCRPFRLEQRHKYLESLGKIQMNPKKPGYISPLSIVAGTDGEFAVNVAKTSIQSYNTFLKTL